MPSTAVRTVLAGRVLHITIDRPDSMNAVDVDDLLALDTAIRGAEATGARAIVLTGAGRAFCTGADMTAMRAEAPEVMLDAANRVIGSIVSAPVPVVAAVNGPAVGYGVALACAADLAYAVESAYFLLSFTSIGLMPDGGATALLAAAIGRARATELALLGQRLSATDAAQVGLVARTLPDDQLAAHVEAVAGRLGAGPQRALKLTRRALAASTLGHLDDAFERERVGQIELFATPDFAEGVDAVLTKRHPTFS
jgi:enoyl-CoA hydratase/carnithine racemase